MVFLFLHECDACGSLEERVFTDNWTGKELCIECLSPVINYVTNSPGSDGDNFIKLLIDFDIVDAEDSEWILG